MTDWEYCPNCGSELEYPAGPYREWTDCPECGHVLIEFHIADNGEDSDSIEN